jgi:hypothetical protein
MNVKNIELTPAERELLEKIDFAPSRQTHDADAAQEICNAAGELTRALLQRKAIPEVRIRFFTDPAYNVGGRGSSRRQVFEKNGTKGDAIFSHPHFLKYLRYFLYGPDLPEAVINDFQQKVFDCGSVTSGDIVPLGDYARQLTRSRGLDKGKAAEEFYKLALDCGLDEGEARSIRDAVKKAR